MNQPGYVALFGTQSMDLDALPVTVVRGACWPDYGGALVRVEITTRAMGNRTAAAVLGSLKACG